MSISIGRRAKYFRENMGMTQTEAASRAGMSQATWSRIEGGKTPTAGDVLGLSWALGVPFDTMRGKSAVRERLQFAARSNTEKTSAGDADKLENVKEELTFLLEFAAGLQEAGYLASAR